MYNHLLIIFAIITLCGCKISESNCIGKYLDKNRDDTLNLLPGKKYEFEEKLINGEHGWNTGNWTIDKNRILFSNTNPLPVVGYKLRIHKIGVGQYPLHLLIKIDQLKKDIQFTDIRLLDKGLQVNGEADIIKNRIVVNTNRFDTIGIKIAYFPMMAFDKYKFDLNGIYEVIIYPAERLYELDKSSYKYKNGHL